MYFLLGESDFVVDISDDDASDLLEGMNKEVIELPLEPKEDPKDATDPGGGATGNEPEVEFQTASDFASAPVKDNVIAGFSSSPLAALGVYILEWGFT